jgi:predicted amidohydrolase
MRIGLVSLNQKWEQKTKNLIACENFIKKAAQKKVDLIIFPEMTLTGFSINSNGLAENENSSYTLKAFKSLAKKYSINIVFGVILRNKKKLTNNAILVSSQGNIKLRYKKIHLFSFALENNFFSPGDKLPSINLKSLRIGLTVCYDLRFPELFRALAKNCNLIINIANWPKARIHHWNTLLTARAIENQLFIAGVNRTGIDGNNIKYISSSQIISPDGAKLKQKYNLKLLSIYDINLNLCLNSRSIFPALKDRNFKFYRKLLN